MKSDVFSAQNVSSVVQKAVARNGTSAEALVLAPDSCIRIARSIVSNPDYGERCINAARTAVDIISEAIEGGALQVADIELAWVAMLRDNIDAYAGLGEGRVDQFAAQYADKFIPAEYGLV